MSWKQKSYRFSKNVTYFRSQDATLTYIPLTGSTADDTDINASAVHFPVPGPGILECITFVTSATTPGSTVFTLKEADGTTLGTKTVALVGSFEYNLIDFTTGLDSGTNKFDGTKMIVIGVNATSGTDDSQLLVTFELDF